MRPRHVLAALIAAVPLAGCGHVRHAAGVATGLVSHQVCSAAFVSRVDPDRFYDEAVAPALGPARLFVTRRVDLEHGEVSARLLGLAESRAVYRGDLGCLVLRGAPPPPVTLSTSPREAPLLPPIAGAEVVTPTDPRLRALLDREFAEPAKGPPRHTKAVVILRDGRVIAERYAPGYGPQTPITGWSMTKSVVNALVGVLVREHRLAMDGAAPVPEWSRPGDPRHAITPDQLLRMTSGLALGQSLAPSPMSAFDISARAVFDERDMAGFAAQAALASPPGHSWTYADGSTLILSRIVRDLAGGNAAAVTGFARRELFDKLGMTGAVLEVDATGTPIGASHMWAPARDWARLGQLYLDDGMVGGERILPAGWVDYSTRPTPGSERFGYGAGFWTNRGSGEGARRRTAAGMPADAFFAHGNYGQAMVVIPSRRMVIVRLGWAQTPQGDFPALERLTADAVAAVADDSAR